MLGTRTAEWLSLLPLPFPASPFRTSPARVGAGPQNRRGQAFARLARLLVGAALIAAAPGHAAAAPRERDADAGKTVVYRDEYGVPHLYADTIERGLYAMGYAQAEDRLEELLKNYLRATGEMAAVFGESQVREDAVSRIWDHYGVARRNFGQLRPELRRHMEAFARGVNDYMRDHPAAVPDWWGKRAVDAFMQVAHSRQFMWGWPLGQALGDLRAAGLEADFNVDMRSSNEWVVGPKRTSVHAPILLIDPHLSWWGAQRFWECRLHAGGLHASSFTLPGSIYVGLGHNDHVAWAMTTGGPDTSDIYELTLNPTNHLEYRYDGSWRVLKQRALEIAVKGREQPQRFTVYESHHGPVVARRGDKAYVAKLAYADEVKFGEAFYHFNFATDVRSFRRGLELNQLMPQNVMAADTGGNIFYMRSGRVPIRPAGFDFFKPVDGSTSKSEWKGIHPAQDLYQVLNPPQGYMQNCNISPDVMMPDSPLKPGLKPAYLFGERARGINQRGARAVQLLEADGAVTPEQARAYALDTHCIGFERWLAALGEADRDCGQDLRGNADYQAALGELKAWDGRSDAESTAALKYYYWRQALNRQSGGRPARDLAAKINDLMAVVERRQPKTVALETEAKKALVTALAAGMTVLREEHGRLEVRYGEVFRVGRDDRSWPVGGGSLNEEGMGTLRAIGFERPRADHTRWGTGGQTSTQVVVLGKPIRSWTQPPIGQSDHPDSPYYRDQAEKLFSRAELKPTWYAREELLQHVSSREELHPPF
jgi:acyl-homoserine lactone acylase PvdQ